MATASPRHPAADLAEQRLRTHIRRHLPHARVWLFGSRARGDASRRSDFDLAVEPGCHTGQDLLAFEEAIRADTEIIYPVDVVDMGTVAAVVRQQIKREGRSWTV